VGAADQIALPMTGNGAILDFSRPLPDVERPRYF
jgi:hypothetical protein